MATSKYTPARLLMVAANLSYSVGAFIADYNETHVLNPRWPPHAKFHNGQTMTLGVLLSLTSAYYILRSTPSLREDKDSLWTGAWVGSFYTAAGLSASWYPGTLWIDPEFGEGRPQFYVFSGILILNWLGYFSEKKRLGGIKSA